MVTIRNTGSALRLTLVAATAVSLAACASHPKPAYPTAPPPVAQRAPEPQRAPTAPPRAEPVSQSPLPGSERDFSINIGDRVSFDYDSFTVKSDAGSLRDAQTGWLKRYPYFLVRIYGKCFYRGTQ